MKHQSLILPALAVLLFSSSARADVPNEDESPPTVSIVSPTNQQMFEGAPATIAIEVSAVDDDTGVSSVVVSVDGVEQPELTEAPYTLGEVVLEAGMHEIAAVAANGDGYESAPVTVTIVVFPAAGESSSSGDDGPVDEDEPPAEEDDDKGGCTVGRERSLMGSGLAFAFAVLAGLRLRRRD